MCGESGILVVVTLFPTTHLHIQAQGTLLWYLLLPLDG